MAARKISNKQTKTQEEPQVTKEEIVEEKEEEEESASSEEEENTETSASSGSEEDSCESSQEEELKAESAQEEVEKVKAVPVENKDEKTIFVKGLSYEITDEAFQKMFEECGEIVEVRLPRANNDSGRTDKGKGFGYIEFAEKESCEKALKLNNTECDGRALVVDMAKGKPPRREESSSREPRQRVYQNQSGEVSVFLGNVPFLLGDSIENYREDFLKHLRGFADVKDLRVPIDQVKGDIKGFAFASVESMEEAEKLIQNTIIFKERCLRPDISTPRTGGESSGPRDRGFGGRSDNRSRGGFGGNRGGFGSNRGGDFSREKRTISYDNAENKGENKNKHVKFE
ncbi:hypothetical protein NECID01_1991 [Nematocida sp. AWRm77]|nr:hypothetical protein NECID01_1991 [Nematocida sp. AWRm77]